MEIVNHVLVGVVPVVAYSLLRSHRPPTGTILLVVFVGSLLPDLVDKPLAWTVGLIPSGRMFLHSIVVATPLCVTVLLVTSWAGYRVHGVVFCWGYLTHIFGDFYPIITMGSEYYYYPNLFWPLMSANPDRTPGFAENLPAPGIEIAPTVAVGTLLTAYIIYDIRRQVTVYSQT